MEGQQCLSSQGIDFGKSRWRLVALSSDSVNTYFMVDGLNSANLLQNICPIGPINISTTSHIIFGNNQSGTEPVKLLKRVEIYSSFYNRNSPSALPLIQGRAL